MKQKSADRLPIGKRLSNWLNDQEIKSMRAPLLIFGAFALLCYLFFCYHDILLTAQHSYAYLDGRILDYYSGSYDMDGTYGSNYLPTTFILFAIWNIPLKIFGAAPEFYGDWGVLFTLWNKLLPVLFYFASACVLYKLANDRLHFGRGKSIIAASMLIMSPFAFFSQFMFCQYDSFVIFFMLLGMYFFFAEKPTKKHWLLFSLFFGIATTFKYFAAVIFAILLLLREKKIPKILLWLLPFAAPLAIEFGVYFIFDRHAFVSSVMNFGALEYAKGFALELGSITVNLIYLSLIIICAFAYFTTPKNDYDLVGWSCFYACGVCFVLFGLMNWHPQWLLFAVPFWTLSTVINKHWSIFILIDSIAAVIFNVFVVNYFVHQTDETLFRYGILSPELQFSEFSSFSMYEVFKFTDTDLMFTLLAVVFLVSFIFKHPRFNMEKPDEPLKRANTYVTARFLCGALTFIIPAFICLPSFLAQPTYLWGNFAQDEAHAALAVTEDKQDFCQYLSIDGTRISYIEIQTSKSYDDREEAKYVEDSFHDLTPDRSVSNMPPASRTLTVEIFDVESGIVLGKSTLAEPDISNGGYSRFDFEDTVYIENGTLYGINIYSSSDGLFRVICGSVTPPTYRYYNIKTQDYSDSSLVYCGNTASEGVGAVMSIFGE